MPGGVFAVAPRSSSLAEQHQSLGAQERRRAADLVEHRGGPRLCCPNVSRQELRSGDGHIVAADVDGLALDQSSCAPAASRFARASSICGGSRQSCIRPSAERSRARLRLSSTDSRSFNALAASGTAASMAPRLDSTALAFQYANALATGLPSSSACSIALRHIRAAWARRPARSTRPPR